MAQCGIQQIAPSPTLTRIYLGTEAVPNSWPWVRYNLLIFVLRESKMYVRI
jgi:hypothetical protein